ncbi:MAG: Asp-tRNA(Asn)/Glu-tRNA(Gln) amidotransferase subunit GatB [Deltaproteobacteria bacterium]|jgi:aspartyl-tRNA(Asn)/glutamyl-tRNA(Gln) amidotransferase subunit B|nr:Asp-tRNA(Asn)/Glu-tRNA(Gln) amidotransferase subunit GatB [Deltaproteobacteria bacterium]
MEMEPVIGLEIHAQLNTRTKLFCACPTEFGAPPNTNICEVCTGQPGALPRMNGRALELAAKAGLALGSRVNERSLFSRKNYFYPDLPNGFQTSQLDPPICEGGGLEIAADDGSPKLVRLNRIHMEDDAGKCIHDEARGISLIDLNRAGTPLIEIVTEPDISSAREAVEFLKKLHGLLVRLGVTRGRLEEGEFRCDVNISLKPRGASELGVRGEIKNLNSFRFVGQAIDYEISRQGAVYSSGGKVLQETLHFDSVRGETRSLRSKEEAHDYRYFPQPDLPPAEVSPDLLARLRQELPENPEDALARLLGSGLKEEQARLILERRGALDYFDACVVAGAAAPRAASLMLELFLPFCQKEGVSPLESAFGPDLMARLAGLADSGTLGRRKVQELSERMFREGADPEKLTRDLGLSQISDEGELMGMARRAVAESPAEAAKYRAGQDKILSFFVGRLMKLSGGRAEPRKAGELLRAVLAEIPDGGPGGGADGGEGARP